ncbi:MAG: nucleotidyltransferase family protein [Thermodesulfobacteriota bacterium]|nr:nucleotidyltransferase family protein [Thermodesulfobacteriota bacterium]
MDFKLVLQKLLTDFKEHDIRYALMGGFALGVWGVPRGTVDIDFLLHSDDMKKVDGIMDGLGYECRFKSENVSQYISLQKVFGEVDFLHAFRVPSLSMLERAVEKRIFNGTVAIMVLKIEDIIGFKVQAIANNESRKAIDLPDIESLIAFNKDGINWDLIEEYFTLFEFNDLFNELKRKLGR